MKMTLVPQQYFDGDGRPLTGRLSVYNRSTDTAGTEVSESYVKLYTYADGEYSDAANPQYLDSEGRLPSSVYFDAAVVSVKLERYTGDSTMGSDEDPSHWEQVDTYDVGMEWEEEPSRFASTLADLKTSDTGASPVTVTGYYSEGDSPARTYIWDPYSNAAEDGGYVVASSISAQGRWILLWDDEIMPCSVYGVFPGKMTNFANLLAYPLTVGSAGLATAPKVRFVYGDYGTGATDYATNKDLVFDPSARFTGTGTVSCRHVEAYGDRKSYIGDFKFTSSGGTFAGTLAHSSWFRTLDAFWDCGARRLVLDRVNFFVTKNVTKTHAIYNAAIESRRSKSLSSELHGDGVADYADGAFLDLRCCSVEGVAFGRYDRLRFSSMVFDQSWFEREMSSIQYSFGKVADGKKIELSSAAIDGIGGNVIDVDRFTSGAVYAMAAAADGMTTLDLRGKECALATLPTGVVSVSDAKFPGGLVADRGLTLSRCTVGGDGISASDGATAVELYDCEVSGITSDGALATLNVSGGAVRGGSVKKSVVNASGAAVGFSIENGKGSGAFDGAYTVNFRKCTVSGTVDCEVFMADDCQIISKVTVFPFLDSDNVPTLSAAFSGNLFEGDGEICFSHHDKMGTSWEEIKAVKIRIVGNRFLGNSEYGVKMPAVLGPFEADDLTHDYSGWEASYLAEDATVACEYAGNTGACPLESFAGQYAFDYLEPLSEGTNCTVGPFRVFALSPNPRAYTSSWHVNIAGGESGKFVNGVASLAPKFDDMAGALHTHSLTSGIVGASSENDMFRRNVILPLDGAYSNPEYPTMHVMCVRTY